MKYYLIGIKGSGMSALACILKDQQHQVSGSDIEKEIFTQKSLDNHEIKYYSFSADNISTDIDEVIVGNVFDESNVEYKRALELNLKITKYTDFLNKLTTKYYSVAISGTNGKTTTTSLVSQALIDTPQNTLIGDSRGYGNKDADLFILEACEYKSNFLNYSPNIGLINNIEMDHPDYFTDLDHVIDVFTSFADKVQLLLINIDDENCLKVKERTTTKNMTYGLSQGDIHFENLSETPNGYKYDLVCNDKVIKDLSLPFYGEHMLYNTLATYSVCEALGKDLIHAHDNLIGFKGAKRRFEVTDVSKTKNIILIDDYAHHPTSVKLTIDAIKQRYPNNKLTAIFQAHTFSRTLEFHKEFAESLSDADQIYITPIFGSIRESNDEINEDLIKDHLSKDQTINSIDDIDYNLNNQVIALLGAGDIDKLYKDKIIQKFKESDGKS